MNLAADSANRRILREAHAVEVSYAWMGVRSHHQTCRPIPYRLNVHMVEAGHTSNGH